MTKLNPCRFCGETEHLQIHEQMDEDWIYNEDGSLKREPSGAFAVVYLDFVRCSICNAQAPVNIWNRADGQWATMRAVTIAAWSAHDAATRLVFDAIKAATGKVVTCRLTWWKDVSPRVPAPQFALALERELGLEPSPYDQGDCVEGVINHFAGRVPA